MYQGFCHFSHSFADVRDRQRMFFRDNGEKVSESGAKRKGLEKGMGSGVMTAQGCDIFVECW